MFKVITFLNILPLILFVDVYVALCFMEVRFSQLKRKMGSDLRVMVQTWLDGCAMLGQDDRISAEELMARLKFESMWECLQDRRLQWFGLLERMGESAWSRRFEP